MLCLFPSPRPLSQTGPYGTILKPLKNNFLFQTLAASFNFKFSFNLSPVLLSSLKIQGGSIPLFTLIPSQIIKSYSYFSTKRLVYLSQLVDVDGTYIQSYPELIFSKIVPRAGIYPNWYKDLLTVVCVNPSIRKLLPRRVLRLS